MAKGSSSKEILIAKLKEVYPDSFMYEKNLIIPFIEDGQKIQLKVALTCCKTNIEQGGDVAVPGAQAPTVSAPTNEKTPIEPTSEEKKNISDFLSSMGF